MKNLPLFIAIIALWSSCAPIILPKVTMPPYTNVNKILKLKQGMKISEVNEILEIEPYNVYSLQEDGASVLVYNYRIKDRKVEIPEHYLTEEYIRSESGQGGGGIPVYQPESHSVYVFLKDSKFRSLVTDAGKENAEYLLLIDNHVRILSKDDLSKLKTIKVGDTYILDHPSAPESVLLKIEKPVKQIPVPVQIDKQDNSKKFVTGCLIGGLILSAILGILVF